MSASDELQPRLTRIVDPARSEPTPIAASTWLGPTLLEEQAAPALTMTPSRSSPMTWLSAGRPGSSRADVLGARAPGPRRGTTAQNPARRLPAVRRHRVVRRACAPRV